MNPFDALLGVDRPKATPLLAEDQIGAPPPPAPDWRAMLRAAVACLEGAAAQAPSGYAQSLRALAASARALLGER